MYIEKLTSQIINDVLSGLGGYHSNLSINRDQVADEIVALRLSLLKDYYESKGLNGYNFTYLNPAMNRVMQAVGRLIRSENDRGSVLLIDSRYLYKNYLSLFRKDRDNYKVIKNVDDLKKVLQDFYNN